MSLSSAFPLRSFRMLVVTVALVFASTFGFAASQVSADVLVPGASTGGAGGGGGSAQVDETERSLALIALTSDTGFVAQSQNEQSIALIESTFTAGGVLVGGEQPVTINGRGQVAYTETEHALAQNAIAAAELAPQANHPGQAPY
jgi:hypothetical protein